MKLLGVRMGWSVRQAARSQLLLGAHMVAAPAACLVTAQAALASGRGGRGRGVAPGASISLAHVSLAEARFQARPEVPESSIGGQSTCIICFEGEKTHLAAPCGHQCVCGPCSSTLKTCPYCRADVGAWVQLAGAAHIV